MIIDIFAVCKEVDAAYAKGNAGKHPDIVIDFTRHGIPSEAVKMITKVMTLPTISGTFGQEGDIRTWRDLSANQKNYLIQIAPPPDLVPQAVRSLVSQQDMTSAVLLFDDEYGTCMYWPKPSPAYLLIKDLGNMLTIIAVIN